MVVTDKPFVSDISTVQNGTSSAGAIVKTPGVCGGVARLKGRRVPVWLLEAWRRDGLDVPGILEFLPDLTAPEIEAALLYAQTHSEEINHQIELNEEA
jgi:uncharacterized protein (DUF433 family)